MSATTGERRRSRRFAIELPVEVLKLSNEAVEMTGQTHDVSSVGACFTVPVDGVREGSPIEFLVTLKGSMLDLAEVGDVRLRCRGRVIRQEPRSGLSSSGSNVAATIDRYQFVRE